jgi:hypothetical protein
VNRTVRVIHLKRCQPVIQVNLAVGAEFHFQFTIARQALPNQ